MRVEDRNIPPDIEGGQDAIEIVERWIGSAWLSNSQTHRLRDLWRRPDFVSSVELAIIGKSIQRLQASQAPARLVDLAKALKDTDLGNQVGSIYELTTAAMLSVPHQAVRLLGPQQPAYDIELDAMAALSDFHARRCCRQTSNVNSIASSLA